MDTKDVARQLEALASETRLAIFRQLCEAGNTGLSVGKIKEKIDIHASTLSHHIAKLVNAGLVDQARNGRTLICTARQEQVDALVMYLANEYCGADSTIWG